MKYVDILSHLLQATQQFFELKLWERFTNYDCFAIEIENQNAPLLGVIMGHAGEEYGLNLFRGPQAADIFTAMLSGQVPDEDTISATDLLGFSLSPFSQLHRKAKTILRKGGLTPGPRDQVPCFLAKAPNCLTDVPESWDLKLLLYILRGLLEANEQGQLEPAELTDPQGICFLTLREDPLAPLVSVTRRCWNSSPAPEPHTIRMPSHVSDLKALPHLDATWLTGLLSVPMAIEGDPRAMKLFLVVEEKSGLVLTSLPIFADQADEAEEALFELFITGGDFHQPGLPKGIHFSSSRLHAAVSPILEPMGVTCTYQASIPQLNDIVESFIEHMNNP